MKQDHVQEHVRRLSRRQILKLGGGLLGLGAASTVLPKALLKPTRIVEAAPGQAQVEPNLHFAASDGWIYLPPPAVPPYHPDNMAPAPFTTYIFGFRNVTGLSHEKVFAQKMKVQLAAPTWWLNQEEDFTLKITNLGLAIRPDLIDAHTLHFHGFRDAIPIFDGEPHSSVGVPISRDLTYFYRPHHPGTYMYHCHFEETEHVHMGMVGVVFIRPLLDQQLAPRRFCYNDEATEFDREWTMMLNEIWTLAHWCDSHVQLPEWSDYAPDFWLLNGRAYPDTIAPYGGTLDANGTLVDTDPVTGDLIPTPGYEQLQYQPISSLVRCNEGDRVLLRFVNLGFREQAMRLTGIPMKLIGRDAVQLKGRDGTDLSQITDTIVIGPGESADAIFVAPSVSLAPGQEYQKFFLYNRNVNRISNGGGTGYGGQMTEVHVYPAGTLPPQTWPNT